MKKITILVPAYNEEESLPFLYERVSKMMDEMKNYEYENWLESNYLTADYPTDEEIKDLYELCKKNKSFEIDELPF